jgi:hypothetical protein
MSNVTLIAAVLSLSGTALYAQQCEIDKLLASDADDLDGFGFTVSLDGNVAISGAWVDEEQGILSGSAYIFRSVGGVWTEEQKLLPADGGPGDRFGHTAAISGNVAVIGAVLDDDAVGCFDKDCDSGSAYVFRFNGTDWVEEQKLLASDGDPVDQFGFAVATDGNVAVIGAVDDDDIADRSGAAYVYRYDGESWIEEQKLKATDPEFFDTFGFDVGVLDDVIAVGNRWDDDDGSNSGSVFMYRFDGENWQFEQEIAASDAAVNANFGHSLSLNQNRLIVGANWDDSACEGDVLCRSGAAYVFDFDGERWNETQKLVSDDIAREDEYGHDVALDGDRAIVSARWNDDACTKDPDCNSGSVYVYHFDGETWGDESKITADDAAATDFYGISVDISGQTAWVGSYLDDDAGTASGSVYVYGITESACSGSGDCDGDGDVDLTDFGTFQLCFTGPNPKAGLDPACECTDFDGDNDADLADFAQFQLSFTGPT